MKPQAGLAFLTLLSGMLIGLSAHAQTGDWNDFERQRAVLNLMNLKSAELECKNSCQHKIFDVRDVRFEDHVKKLIVVTSAPTDYDCHACAPQLSYFFYRVDENQWDLTASFVGFHNFGSWGVYPQDLMSFERLSGDKAAVFLRFSYTGQGYTEFSTTILLEKNGKLEQILNTCSGSDNEGAIYDPDTQPLVSWHGDVRVAAPAGEGGPANLIFDIDDAATGSKSTAEFSFDGTKYRFLSGDERMKDCGYDD